MKRFLFILDKPPYQGIQTQETLDMIMATAAFDQEVSLLLMDQGVFQLINHQNPCNVLIKETASMFKSLPLYDVENFYIETESLKAYRLSSNDLFLPVKLIKRQRIASLMAEHQVIISH